MTQTDTHSLDADTAGQVCEILGDRLVSLLDTQLTLKHVHWNVVGPNFIAVHQMLDPQVDEVRAMSDVLAERIAALGGEPLGTPGAIVEGRRWADYKINRANTQTHLAELDQVYAGIVEDNRRAIRDLEELDPVSQDLIVSQTGRLELFHWFVRAHLEGDTTDSRQS
jgi:starvation-inducible DNA-binding protein